MGISGKTLVVGASGILGLQTARLLCEAGVPVRALVRPTTDPAKRAALQAFGAEIVEGDLKDPASLRGPLAGVDSVVSTANALLSRQPGDSIKTVDEDGQLALVAGSEQSGVKTFVYVSFPPSDVDHAFQRAKRRVEARLRESSMSFTVLQPLHFAEVWFSPALGFDPAHGAVRLLGTGEKPLSWVSVVDVARFAAKAALGGPFVGKTLPLGGPEGLSPLQVLGIFEELGAPKVTPQLVPEAALQAQLSSARDPIEEAFAAAMLIAARGGVLDPKAATDLLPGRLTSVRDYARRALSGK